MKKLLAFLLPLLFVGCITGGAEKKWQAMCDDIKRNQRLNALGSTPESDGT